MYNDGGVDEKCSQLSVLKLLSQLTTRPCHNLRPPLHLEVERLPVLDKV